MSVVFCSKCGAGCQTAYRTGQRRSVCPSCGYVHFRNPAPCVSVMVVDRGNHIALARRANSTLYPGKWGLPCGYIELGESFLDGAKREVNEEIGIDIQPVSIVNVVSNVFFQRISSLVIVIQANPLSLELTAGDDADGAAWFDIRQPLPELAFDADRYIIEKYKECLEKGTSMSFIPLSDRESSFEQE